METNTAHSAPPVMPSDEEANKRLHRRLPRLYPVELQRLGVSLPGGVIATNCCDISRGGLCLEARQSFSLGDIYQVRILIPFLNRFSPAFFKVYENDVEQYFVAVGEVIWVKAHGGRYVVGIQFVNVDGDQAVALDRLIKKAFAAAGG